MINELMWIGKRAVTLALFSSPLNMPSLSYNAISWRRLPIISDHVVQSELYYDYG